VPGPALQPKEVLWEYGQRRHGYVRGVLPDGKPYPGNQKWRADDIKAAQRHSGGANYVFMDGHVKWYRPDQVKCSDTECWWSREDEAATKK
jgi:prepilin-type processing-associated H-X9-DG protein